MKRDEIKRTALLILALTILIEGITCFFRFYLGMEATRDTKSLIAPFTGGIRIHHGYIGALLLLFVPLLQKARPRAAKAFLAVGAALFLSDMIHHFCVLLPLTGDPAFHLVYPG